MKSCRRGSRARCSRRGGGRSWRGGLTRGPPGGGPWASRRAAAGDPPPRGRTAWPRSPIEAFALARLEAEQLKPSPEAEPAALIRRASLALTGLPPTPAEVEAFLADRSPGAYEALIDRLLGSPEYGQRIAMDWLDG